MGRMRGMGMMPMGAPPQVMMKMEMEGAAAAKAAEGAVLKLGGESLYIDK